MAIKNILSFTKDENVLQVFQGKLNKWQNFVFLRYIC